MKKKIKTLNLLGSCFSWDPGFVTPVCCGIVYRVWYWGRGDHGRQMPPLHCGLRCFVSYTVAEHRILSLAHKRDFNKIIFEPKPLHMYDIPSRCQLKFILSLIFWRDNANTIFLSPERNSPVNSGCWLHRRVQALSIVWNAMMPKF